ncbi:MAG: dimethyl sulfoxide reductase anchor subunit [Bacteroidetes bacterium]|jgi:Fe-S-cluster-containing dehydrogenase component/DMSO reductase anchor subunit|nr:dimethyl sulfoxide reductase anchor subunit [Bacteroidota bacterium]
MERKAFIFNTNKCVACMACVAGCSIENGTSAGMNWRTVNTFNNIRHPELPVFHFSLACNHCSDALCMTNCPSLAYTRDKETGVIIHHAEACIGCKYCTWACPYDAPKFNATSGIIEKCNFCLERINDEIAPACVSACPVGALEYESDDLPDENLVIPGFVNKGIRPSIRIVPIREENKTPKIMNTDSVELSIEESIQVQALPKSKVELAKEWILVFFTLSAAILVAWFGSHLAKGIPLNIFWFLPLGLISLILSSVHLGKKLRAWRSILNIRRSWLSREILFYSVFLGSGSLYLITGNPILGYISIISGFFALVSIDMVYHVFDRRDKIPLHSAMIWSSGFLIFAYLTGVPSLFGFIILLKTGLYIYRKIIYIKLHTKLLIVPTIIRIISLMVPLVLIFYLFELLWWVIPVVFMVGEIIDRSEFYHEAEVNTPELALHELHKKSAK